MLTMNLQLKKLVWCVQALMLRRCLTWLRATWVVRVLPLDQNILLHQIVGYAILFYTLLHTSAHIFNFGTNSKLVEEGCWNPVLVSPNPAEFSVLPGRKSAFTEASGDQRKESSW